MRRGCPPVGLKRLILRGGVRAPRRVARREVGGIGRGAALASMIRTVRGF